MINKLDKDISYLIYSLVNSNNFIRNIPYYLGLLPYELYVIPGMYLAIIQVLWLNTPNPIQFHLLPHWFAYSLFTFLKNVIDRGRPGCVNKKMSGYIDDSHCYGKHKTQSWPSGHTGVAFSLATALYMEMMYSEDPRFFEFKIKSKTTRSLIAGIGIFVASMISLQRISKGYHHFGDCLSGAVLGGIIGYISWTSLNIYKKYYYKTCENNKSKSCDYAKKEQSDSNFSDLLDDLANNFKDKKTGKLKFNLILLMKIIITLPILYLIFVFFTKTLWKLTSVKH